MSIRWENLDFVIGMAVGLGICMTSLAVWEQWWMFVPRRREPKVRPIPVTSHRMTWKVRWAIWRRRQRGNR